MEERVIVTIKDVARKAGVSSMTVSRAFKAESSIKKETRERILEIAKSLNYIPDFNAKSLVTKCKFSIGIFFSSMTTGMSQIYLGELINKIYELLPENYLLSVNSINRVMQMKENIAGRFDGIIIISQSKEDDNFIKEIKEFKLPLVVMNREIKDSKVVNVASNEEKGINELAFFLKNRGIQKVGTISGMSGFFSTKKRLEYFTIAAKKNNLNLMPRAIQSGDYSIESGYKAMEVILKEKDIPEAIFCANDDMAIGAIKACVDNGLNVPKDISIAGFDDTDYVKYLTPALTTIHKPYEEMAKLSMELLLKLINKENVETKKYILESKLIKRESII